MRTAAQRDRVSKLITLNIETKKALTLQAVQLDLSLQAYIEQILTQAVERAEEQLLLGLIEEGDQEIITGAEKQEFEQYMQSLTQ